MKLCAQLYSVRKQATSAEEIRRTFRQIKDIGYEAVQVSALAAIPACELRDISLETDLPIVCTHSPIEKIIGDTDALIADHKTYGCPVIGVGAMPVPYRESEKGTAEFISSLCEAEKKIRSAGLALSYHNHDFEFTVLPNGKTQYDMLLDACPTWHFILDTYWVEYAGYSAVEYIKKIGGERLTDIHYKDMARDESRSICACGDGVMDFRALTDICEKIGVKNVLVEQDNATDLPSPFEQMRKSYRYLLPIIHHS
ncbi:MAG: sugar phosphate isomerase/epimerase [Clostridia bacterium]|nr:sugar phosphate isomerase/epimerase [Clostridia bacterium]